MKEIERAGGRKMKKKEIERERERDRERQGPQDIYFYRYFIG